MTENTAEEVAADPSRFSRLLDRIRKMIAKAESPLRGRSAGRCSEEGAGMMFSWLRRRAVAPDSEEAARRRVCVPAGCPLSATEFSALSQYNARRAQGVVHTEWYDGEMSKLQSRYSEWLRIEADVFNYNQAWKAGMF